MKAAEIRKILAREFRLPENYEFFRMDRRPDESTDQMLERVFNQERAQHPAEITDEQIVLVLAHG